MPCASNTYSGVDIPRLFWANWSSRVSGATERWYLPDALPDLVNVVQQATAESKELRPLGSGWAFEDLAYSPQRVVNLDRLCKRLTYVTDSALTAERRSRLDTEVPVHVEAGIKIATLNAMLDGAGLGLPTLGGANGQSLAGAISTGTHGGDIDQPPLADLVLAMHVVGVNGQEFWVERASEPLTDDTPLAAALTCPSARIVRDDEIFNALLVSVGRFGVIYSYVVRTVKAFRLAEWTCKFDTSALISRLRAGQSSGTFLQPLLSVLPQPPAGLGALDIDHPRGLEVAFNSQDLAQCWVKRRWITNDPTDLENDYTEDFLCHIGAPGVLAISTAALGAATSASFAIPIAGPFLATLVGSKIAWLQGELAHNPQMSAGEMLAKSLQATWDIGGGPIINEISKPLFDARFKATTTTGKRGISHLIISGFPEGSLQNCYRANSVEPVFDAHQSGYLDFLEKVIAAAPAKKQSGYFSLRWSATSRATLGMHNHDSAHAVAIEITSLQGLSDNNEWMSYLGSLTFQHDGRPHWGQQNWFLKAISLPGAPWISIVSKTVGEVYGARLDRWRTALTRMCGQGSLFSCNFTRTREMEPPAGAVPETLGRSVNDIRGGGLQPQLRGWAGFSNAGVFASGPAVASMAPNRLDVFGRGTDDALYTTSWTGAAWTNWNRLSSNRITSDPAAVSWGPGRIDVFARGTDNQMYTIFCNGSRWSDWGSVGNGQFNSGPGVASMDANRMDLFGRGTDDTLYAASWTGAAWTPWRQLSPNKIASDPVAVSWAPGRIDVFARGTDNQMYTIFWDGSTWSGWVRIGNGLFSSGPAVASMEPNRLDLFGRGTDNALYTASWTGSQWAPWRQLAPNKISSDPDAVSWGPGRIDVFARGTDKQLYTIWWDGSRW